MRTSATFHTASQQDKLKCWFFKHLLLLSSVLHFFVTACLIRCHCLNLNCLLLPKWTSSKAETYSRPADWLRNRFIHVLEHFVTVVGCATTKSATRGRLHTIVSPRQKQETKHWQPTRRKEQSTGHFCAPGAFRGSAMPLQLESSN